ncbi:hypothetical protein GCM10007876_26600 [Litoribrevibacter albus]|uniref:Uncharacterized protein n=1 Tax=Litoribrevibacter albus TaxID=1473156 RepID=A0AA37SCW9_9GAMM|nr:hypothetical protein GCM10007876_26600 [Litoribrevibacter albus]
MIVLVVFVVQGDLSQLNPNICVITVTNELLSSLDDVVTFSLINVALNLFLLPVVNH